MKADFITGSRRLWRFFPGTNFWIWSALLLSLLICGAISYLHFEQQLALQISSAELENMRQARIDLNKGLLFIIQSETPNSPYNREQGLALMEQAIFAFDRSLETIGSDVEAGGAFRRSVDVFQRLLEEWSLTPADQTARLVDLRIAFADLERQAERVDTQSQERFRELSGGMNRQFALAIIGSAVLLSGICGIVIVISLSRQRSEQDLRQRNVFIETILENAPIGFAVIRAGDGACTFVNNHFERIFGVAHGSIHDLEDFFRQVFLDAGQRAEMRQRMLDDLASGQPERMYWENLHIKTAAGEDRVVTIVDIPLHEQDLIISTVQDVSERWHAEEEIHQLNAGLERRVAERTAQLEAANKELEAFSYSVSHDLRTPLRGIDGWSLALLEDYQEKLDETGRQYIQRVRNETQRMGRLIDDLLRLSQVTRMEMQVGVVDLSALARSIAAQLNEAQPERVVEWAIQDGLHGRGDAHLLEIALSNLLGNAFKFTGKQAQARIEFHLAHVNGSDVYAIRDNGVGFSMESAKNLFGAFQRLHKAADFPGTGIGLATVQRIIRRHGGQIWAESEKNAGATFYFTLEENS